jgi:CRISPR/Cas system-associated exonuclease Cas4 (RecB family)
VLIDKEIDMNAPTTIGVLSHLSASSLSTFRRCPRQFRLKYLDRIQPSFRASALAFGVAFHVAVGEHLLTSTTTEQRPVGELWDLFVLALDEQLDGDGPPVLFDDGEDRDVLVALGRRMLEAFVEHVPMPDEVRAVEVPFSIDLVDPATGEVLPPLIGSIDALVVKNGLLTVWELKSGKRKWPADQIAYDLQPTAYRIGMRAHGIENIELELVLTTKAKAPDVQLERLVRGKQDERDFIATAASVVRAVEAGVDHPIRSGWQCRGCAYAHACR